MNRQDIFTQIIAKKSYLCVGLDTDPGLLPAHLLDFEDPVFEFNRQIIEATAPFAVAYKPNLAFYEAQGPKGWESLRKTLDIIPDDCLTIADAKRGDIGNTSALYARTFFDPQAAGLDFDAVTVAPYMGRDSVLPFLQFGGKWVILLALTSNEGSSDFQNFTNQEGRFLFEEVIRLSQHWASPDQLMYVVGATRADRLAEVRRLAPEHFLLVPGVGAQGGSLREVSRHGLNAHCGLLVNATRSIIYASSGPDFAEKARQEAQLLQEEMAGYLAEFLP
jgi:orotidine-5'-phosphate decarboxylase